MQRRIKICCGSIDQSLDEFQSVEDKHILKAVIFLKHSYTCASRKWLFPALYFDVFGGASKYQQQHTHAINAACIIISPYATHISHYQYTQLYWCYPFLIGFYRLCMLPHVYPLCCCCCVSYPSWFRMGHHPCFVSCRQHSRHNTANENTPGYNSSEYSEVIPELDTIIVSVNVFVILAELYIYPVVGLISWNQGRNYESRNLSPRRCV